MARRVSGVVAGQGLLLYIAENYSTYGVEILLTRSFTPFLVTVYVPSGLLVLISWVPYDSSDRVIMCPCVRHLSTYPQTCPDLFSYLAPVHSF